MLRASILLWVLFVTAVLSNPAAAESAQRFEVSFPPSAHAGPLTGRLIVSLTKSPSPEPRTQIGDYRLGNPFFGVDVAQVSPGQAMIVDSTSASYPLESLAELPPGDYYAQALLNVYTKFDRADGKTLWLHLDQGEGQELTRAPGNLYSEVEKISVDASGHFNIKLALTHVIPPIPRPADTPWIKRIRIQSKLLTKFWGRPMYLGASIVLPKGYAENPNVHYPVLYFQGHFVHDASFLFSSKDVPETAEAKAVRLGRGRVETPFELYKEWTSSDFPRMLLVAWEHPTPFYDASYAVNSANNGPYGDAILQELIPYIEEHFRIIREPYARVLTGGSTGRWESLALQVYHPDVFGGAWVFNPDPVDFRGFLVSNLYDDDNAFLAPRGPLSYLGIQKLLPERPWYRDGDTNQVLVTLRQMSQMEAALGSHQRSGTDIDNWSAVFAPVGDDGYPRALWDKKTGVIDHEAVNYAREHNFDLVDYLKSNWPRIGPQLVGKLHVWCPDMDQYQVGNSLYRLDEFLTNATPHYGGTFTYGRRAQHGWHQMSNAEMMRSMADHIMQNASDRKPPAWIYP